MALLTLRIEYYWFNEIECGRKKVEYRDLKPYYESRIDNKNITEVLLIVGYKKDAIRRQYKVKKIVKSLKRKRYEIHLVLK
jgi:hypothetical protein